MESRKSAYDEKLNRCNQAFKRQIPDKVPVVAHIYSWAEQYYGYSLKKVYQDNPELEFEVFSKIADEFAFDALFALGNNVPFPMLEALRSPGNYRIVNNSVQVCNANSRIMKDDEYPFLIDDVEGFFRDIILPRKFNIVAGNEDDAYKALDKAYQKFMDFGKKTAKVNEQLKDYGVPILIDGGLFVALDFIMDYLRDFSGIICDMRRRPKEVQEACKALSKFIIDLNCSAYKNKDDGHFIFLPLHLATYLKPKDFSELYFPVLRDMLDIVINTYGFNVGMFMEGNWEPYYDILQDLPENDGKLLGLLEIDDPKKFKAVLGHKISIMGGMPINKLAYSTKQECIDHAKKVIDDCAPGGGYMFSFDKPLLYLTDAKPENLRAVLEFANEYGKY